MSLFKEMNKFEILGVCQATDNVLNDYLGLSIEDGNTYNCADGLQGNSNNNALNVMGCGADMALDNDEWELRRIALTTGLDIILEFYDTSDNGNSKWFLVNQIQLTIEEVNIDDFK